MIRLTIPIEPRGQMRARSCVISGHASVYKDKKQQSAESAFMAFLVKHRPDTPLEGALVFGVKAYLPVPASKPKFWKSQALSGDIRPTVKPDIDNVIKFAKDCLTQLGFWQDDKQVVEYLPGTGKYYSEQPRWEIEIRAFRPAGRLDNFQGV